VLVTPGTGNGVVRGPVRHGSALYVGNLQWWTTDVELETACSEFGEVDKIKFFEEKSNGKSKGYALVEFKDASAAASCQQALNGWVAEGEGSDATALRLPCSVVACRIPSPAVTKARRSAGHELTVGALRLAGES
jgi:RNA recognition motif-containing protein